MDQNNKQAIQEKQSQTGQNNPTKKEESVQAGKERMATDGDTHSKNNPQQNIQDKPGFQPAVKKLD